MTKSEKISNAGLVLRKKFPYGLFQDADTGKVVLFNRDYQVLTFEGKKEFDFDPMTLGDIFTAVYDERFLTPDDGSVYVGKMFYLYNDTTRPTYDLDRGLMADYLLKLDRVLAQVVDCIGNAFNYQRQTEEQKKEVNRRLKNLVSRNKKKDQCLSQCHG